MPNVLQNKLIKRQNEEAVAELVLSSKLTTDYYILLVSSAVIVTAGLILDTPSVIIGGMVIAPLLTPILTTALGILLLDVRLLWRSIATTCMSLLIVFTSSYLLTLFFSPEQYLTLEILSRTELNALYLIVAFFSGVGAAYAWARPKLSAVLPGIAVAVSLLPPLAVVGIGVMVNEFSVVQKAMRVFIFNWMGVVIGSFFVFLFLGFIGTRKKVNKVINSQ